MSQGKCVNKVGSPSWAEEHLEWARGALKEARVLVGGRFS